VCWAIKAKLSRARHLLREIEVSHASSRQNKRGVQQNMRKRWRKASAFFLSVIYYSVSLSRRSKTTGLFQCARARPRFCRQNSSNQANKSVRRIHLRATRAPPGLEQKFMHPQKQLTDHNKMIFNFKIFTK
jgi:hypothetical protein